jgi:DNA polymerase-3 subunit epsilon
MSHFVAVDVETANADLASICQIGVVVFDDTGPASTWQSLVNPEDVFDTVNVSIHGITEEAVKDAPTLPGVCDQLRAAMADQIVVCHTAFDRIAVRRVCEKYQLPPIECRWLDSARVVRRTWPEFRSRGYGLAPVAEKLGITFDHHVAKEDARVAGLIVLRAIAESGVGVEQWLARAMRPVDAVDPIAREGNPHGPLFGEVVVFTGTLSIPRREAASLAADLGCTVAGGVTRETTLLVVGDQAEWRLAGYTKSGKQRKAERLIAEGQHVRVVGEQDFFALAGAEVTG